MNEVFLNRMHTYLQEEYEAFVQTLDKPYHQALRIHTPKISRERFLQEVPLNNPSPFCADSFYISGSWGLHPWHQAGGFYLQEPSASSPVDILDVQPDDAVLDLCAAPGSKSTQILRNLTTGFLVANEIDPKRAKILLSNLERMGAVNFAYTNMNSAQLCRQFPETFDKILVDAPCSGEAMMKKHDAAQDWSEKKVAACAALQQDILEEAAKALKPGGRLVYSTCAYSREENEETVKAFLTSHPDFVQVPIQKPYGRPDLDKAGGLRVFPMDGGEGHFAACFEKTGQGGRSLPSRKNERPDKLERQFLETVMRVPFTHYWHHNGLLYGMYHPFVKIEGKVLRQGVLIGESVKGRFEPAHAFFLSCAMTDSPVKTELDLEQADDFMHGRQISLPAPKGWRSLCWKGLPLGFGKSDGTVIKNKLPKGLRLMEGSHLNTHEV